MLQNLLSSSSNQYFENETNNRQRHVMKLKLIQNLIEKSLNLHSY